MIRVVIDVNVLVSALIGSGPSRRIVSAAFNRLGIQAVVCPLLIAEITDVLARPRIRKRVSVEEAAAFVDNLLILLDLADDPNEVEAILRDPKDNYLVALARQHEAGWIITGDKDLLEWEQQLPPAIAPADFESDVLGVVEPNSE